MDLNPQQFFHGTRAPGLGVGDTLKPHNKLPGKEANYGGFENHSKDKVFMVADDERRAWTWARGGALHQGERTSVLRVNPGADLRVGPAETTAKSAKVTEKIDIKPGNQGTFPLNWNQFTAKPLGVDQANHPNTLQIELGHEEGNSVARQTRAAVARKQEVSGQEQADHRNTEIARGQGRLF